LITNLARRGKPHTQASP